MADKPNINIYLDTSIKAPHRRNGWYGYVLEGFPASGAPKTRMDIQNIENATECQAALTALEEALKRITRPCHIIIYTDTAQLAAPIENGWLPKWKSASWKNAKGQDLANSQKWQAVEELLGQHEYDIALNRHHGYKEWLRWELDRKKKERKRS